MKKMTNWLACLLACLLTIAPMVSCVGTDGDESDTENATVTESGSVSENESDPGSESVSESGSESESTDGDDPADDTMTIAGTPITAYAVVVPAEMTVYMQSAVDSFTKWMKETTGYELPVITPDQSAEHEIVLGKDLRENEAVNAAVLEITNDGYAIVVDGGDLYISATTHRGVGYGIYDFLTKYMGVRFYGINYTYLRDVGTVTLAEGLKDVYSPRWQVRSTSGYYMYDESYIPGYNYGYMITAKHTDRAVEMGDPTFITAGSGHSLPGYSETEGSGVSPCMRDDDVYALVLKNILAELTLAPNRTAVGVSAGDGYIYCKCEKCTDFMDAHGGKAFAPLLDFINRLADDINKAYPGVRVNTYIYQYTHGVPEGMSVSDNVNIWFCMDEACFQHAINDPNCPKNVKVAAEMRAWAELCKVDNFYQYDYEWNHGGGPLPDPNPYVYWENAQFLKECDLAGGHYCNYYMNGGNMDDLRYYLRHNLAWNPDMTKEEYTTMMEEFMADYYGDAAPAMKCYLDALYAPENITNCSAMYAPWEAFIPVVDAEGKRDLSRLIELYTIFTDALKIETLTEDARAHVEKSSMHLIWYYKNFLQGKERRELDKLWREYVDKYGLPANTTR